MNLTFGSQPETAPPGTFREIIFPQLALIDEPTNEGYVSRMLSFAGGGTRELPRTIYAQFSQSYGHDGAVAFAALHEVTLNGDADPHLASGKGWISDTPEGRKAALMILSQSLKHNSVDLAETEVEIVYEGDPWDDDFKVLIMFNSWKIGATTLVGVPAFADAYATLTDDEVTAQLTELTASMDDPTAPLVVDCPFVINSNATPPSELEVMADAATLVEWEAFHQPEPETPHAIKLHDNGRWVSGHVALWDSCHEGVETHCVIPPRPPDGFASFNQPGAPTQRGPVPSGPIFLAGGHKRAPDGDFWSAYGKTENAWADVRVVPGVHGPWASGVIRPGVDPDLAYAGLASRVSGHWKGDKLRAIVSVNAEGFNIPGSGFRTDENGVVTELVASFPGCVGDQQSADEIVVESGKRGHLTTEQVDKLLAAVPEINSFEDLPAGKRELLRDIVRGLAAGEVTVSTTQTVDVELTTTDDSDEVVDEAEVATVLRLGFEFAEDDELV